MKKLTLNLAGLGCADCAAKIEASVSAHPAVSSAALNFTTGVLRVEYSGVEQQALTGEIEKSVHRFEPEVTVTVAEGKQSSGGGARSGSARLVRIAGAAAFFAAGIIARDTAAALPLFLLSWLAAGSGTLLRAFKNIAKGQIFDEHFLMTVASAGAYFIGEYAEGAAVMLFYQVGEYFQELAVSRSRRSIAELLDIRPDSANAVRNGAPVRVPPEEVAVGEVILVRPGEKIPLDGRVVSGSSDIDTSALTGESLPREAAPGGEVLSGSVNLTGLLHIQVTRPFSESTVSKILALVEEAGSRKAPSEQFITKFARYYTPAVVGIAALIALIPSLIFGNFLDYVNRALVFLVVSCPCALVLSVPLSFFAGIGAASKSGVLIKGGSFLEALPGADTVVFDKTGTLTEGKFTVTGVSPVNISEAEFLKFAAHAEHHSAHPIAKSVREAYEGEIDPDAILEYEEQSGFGVIANIAGDRVLAGSRKLLEREGISLPEGDGAGTVVHLAKNGVYLGALTIADKIKPDSKQAVGALRRMGVRRLVMLTGDGEAAGKAAAAELGLDEYYAGLLPHEKVAKLEALHAQVKKGGKLLFVGDGINDAPSLARADIGVAMGGVGSDAAIEAADIVIMNDAPSKLAPALGIAKKTRIIVWQNIVFALGTKGLILLLAAFGFASMWAAVFADVGVSLIAVLNALRVLRAQG